MPTVTSPIPRQEFSQNLSAQSARHTTDEGARRIRVLLSEVGRVGRSHAAWGRDAHRRGKRRPRAASFGEALQDLLPAPLSGESKCDPAVEIDPLKRNVRRVALRPPCIGQVLLRRVSDGARPQEKGEPARPDDGRFQRPEGELAAWVEHGLLVGSRTGAVPAWVRLQPPPHRTAQTDFPYAALLSASRHGLCDLSTRSAFGRSPIADSVISEEPEPFMEPRRTPPLPAEAATAPRPHQMAPHSLLDPQPHIGQTPARIPDPAGQLV